MEPIGLRRSDFYRRNLTSTFLIRVTESFLLHTKPCIEGGIHMNGIESFLTPQYDGINTLYYYLSAMGD